MPLDPAFVADCPYGPGALLIDDIVSVDRESSTVVARMPTSAELPLTRDQRAHPERHPRHVNGGLIVHATGILGFAHAYYLLELRHADGWIGHGASIHDAKFKKMATIGEPLELTCTAVQSKKIKNAYVVRYTFKFSQAGELVYTSDQTAWFHQVGVPERPGPLLTSSSS
jgi:hypothetical protein